MSSHYILTALFTSGITPPRTHVKWSSLRSLTFRHLQPQVNYQQNQIFPFPLLINCINQLRLQPNHTTGRYTSSPLSFAITGNIPSVITSAIGGNLDPLVPEPPASLRRNFLAHRTADASGVCSSGPPVSTMVMTTYGGRVMVGYGLAMIRFRKSASRRWPLKVPRFLCSSTRGFYIRGHLLHVNRRSGNLRRLLSPRTQNPRNPSLFKKVTPGHKAKYLVPGRMTCSLGLLETFLLDEATVQCHSQSRNPQVCMSQHHR